MSRPKSYRYQPSCVNCKYGHIYYPSQDEGAYVVCLFDGEVFPKFDTNKDFTFEEHFAYTEERDAFCDPRSVAENGFCDEWADCDKARLQRVADKTKQKKGITNE